MTDPAAAEWDRQGTPHEVSSDWDQEQSEYGTTVSPGEWDDYSSEQSVPVAPPRPRPVVQDPVEVPSADTADVSSADTAEVPTATSEEVPAAEAEEAVTEPTPAPLGDEPFVEQTEAVEDAVGADPELLEDLGQGPTEADTTILEPAADADVLGGVFREDSEESVTQALPGLPDQASPLLPSEEEEEQRVQAFVDAERRARNERLGVVETSPENATRPDPRPVRVSTDGFLGSFSLFVLRLVTAGILGIIGYQILSGIDEAANLLGSTLIPDPRLVTWILGFLLLTLALLLILGLLQRVVGFLLLVVAVMSLAFLRWGPFNPFQAGIEGFRGDRDLLLAAVGLVLLGLGGGLWGLDGAFRRARAKARAARQG